MSADSRLAKAGPNIAKSEAKKEISVHFECLVVQAKENKGENALVDDRPAVVLKSWVVGICEVDDNRPDSGVMVRLPRVGVHWYW